MSATTDRVLPGEKAGRIVDAMRRSVAQRGVAGSTFDVVAREAGVSRGLLHYYFDSKEDLLAEVVRRDCDLRMHVLDEQLAGAKTPEAFLSLLVFSLEQIVHDEPDSTTGLCQLFTLSPRTDKIAAG